MKGARGGAGFPRTTAVLAILMLGVHVWSMSRTDAVLLERCGVEPASWRAWQPATYAIVHTTWAHLLVNLALLGLYGPGTERRAKSWGLALVFAGSAVAGGFAHVLFGPGTKILVGASGAVSGILAARAVAVPSDRIHLVGALLWAGANAAAWATDPQGERNLAYASHLGGFAAGALLGGVLRLAIGAPKPGRRF